MSRSSAAQSFSETEALTPTSGIMASPAKPELSPEALAKRAARKKRRWRCTTRGCQYRNTVLTPKMVKRVPGAFHCPSCDALTLERVDAQALAPSDRDRGENYFCKNKCAHRNYQNPVTPEMLQRQGNVLICPLCNDTSLVSARPDGMPTWHHTPDATQSGDESPAAG